MEAKNEPDQDAHITRIEDASLLPSLSRLLSGLSPVRAAILQERLGSLLK